MASKRRTTITREGAYYLFVLAFVLTGAVLREINLMLVLAGMMIGPLVVNWRVARRMTRQLTVARRAPEVAQAGQSVTVAFRVTSGGRVSTLVLEDQITRNGAAGSEQLGGETAPTRPQVARGSALVADSRAGESATASYRVRFEERGEYRLGPLRISSAFPFGMVRSSVRLAQSATVLVYPRIGRLTRRWASLTEEASQGAQRRPRQGPAEGEFYALRNWRSGDSRRHIHWRTSARRGALMVRQFERLRGRNLTIVLDPWQPADPTRAQIDAVENAVSFAATLIVESCRRGGAQLVLSIAGSAGDLLHGECASSLEREAMRRLAEVVAHRETPLDAAIENAIQRSTGEAALVLVTTRDAKIGAPRPSQPATERIRQSLVDRMVVVRCDRAEVHELIEFDLPPVRSGGTRAATPIAARLPS